MKPRLHRLLSGLSLCLVLGLGYGIFCLSTGLYLPCIFHLLTGLDCPGCGITRMCLSLMQLDFSTAFSYNLGLTLVLPLLVVLFVRFCHVYVRDGRTVPKGWESLLLWIVIVWLLLWGVLRNL